MDVSPPIIIKDTEGYPIDSVDVTDCYKDSLANVMIPRGLIEDRTKKLAELIHSKLGDKPIVALCVLKGAFRFYNLLVEKLLELRRSTIDDQTYHPIYYDFLRLKSYADDASSGDVQVIGANPMAQLTGKHILVVEDIIDTGLTMKKLISMLQKYKPASISVVTLLLKRTNRRREQFKADYVGFEIPDKFVVGFGLDFNEAFRDLNHICVINAAGIEKYKNEEKDTNEEK